MKRQDIIKLIPFGIATLLVVISIIQVLMIPNTINDKGETVRYVVSDSILYASFGLVIVLIFIIQRKNYWKYAFGILLVVALTPFIQFYSQTFSFGIGFIQLEVTALGLLFFHFAVNPEIISSIRQKLEPSEESIQKKEELKAEQFESSVSRFQEKFSSKQKSELERIVNENTLVPEAVEAARRLLKKE